MINLLIAGSYSEEVKNKLLNSLAKEFEIQFVMKQEELLQHPETEILIQRIVKMNQPEIDAMPKLRFIQRWGAGYDTVDIAYAGAKGITVSNLAGANAPAVAEQAVNLILASLRNTAYIDRNVRSGNWVKAEVEGRSFMIRGKTLGLIGAGNIGRMVGTILQSFGAQVIYYDKYRMDKEREDLLHFKFVDLDTLYNEADIISVHTPLLESTYHMIGAAEFAKMKKNAVIINTARGGIIDENALCDALRSKTIMAAGIDCFEDEPISENHPLRAIDTVTLSCHVGGNTADIGFIMADMASKNVIAFKNGTLDSRSIVNQEYLQHG